MRLYVCKESLCSSSWSLRDNQTNHHHPPPIHPPTHPPLPPSPPSPLHSVEKRANSSVGLFVTVPGSLTRKAYDQACKRMVEESKHTIPGFRKGQRVPEQVLLNAVGGPQVIINEALDILCEDALKTAIDESDVKAVGQASLVSHPETLIGLFKPGEPIVMELTVDVYPEVTFTSSYKGLKVTSERIPLENEKVKQALDALRKKRVRLVETPAGYTAKLEDSAIVNMKAYQMLSDGTRGPEMRNIAAGEGVEVILEEGRFLPGVVEGLVGKKAGDKVTVPVTFPDNIRDTKLAGLKAEFDVEVLSLKNRVIPEIDAQFANDIREGLTPEGIKQEVVDAVNADAEERTKMNRNKALESALLEITQCEIPECWIQEETRRKFALMMQEVSTQGKSEEEVRKMITKENFEKYREIALPGTVKTLMLGVATAKVAEEEGLEVDPLELQDQIDLRKLEAERSGMDEKALRDQLEAKLLADMVLDCLAANAEITYVDVKEA